MTKVQIEFMCNEPVGHLQDFLDAVKRLGILNSGGNDLGVVISIEDFKYRTDQA